MQRGATRRLALGAIAAVTAVAVVGNRGPGPTMVTAGDSGDQPVALVGEAPVGDGSDAESDTTSSTLMSSTEPTTASTIESTIASSLSTVATSSTASTVSTVLATATAPTTAVTVESTAAAPASTASTTATSSSTTTSSTTSTTPAAPTTTPTTASSTTASGCDPNYTGCVPIASDVDCAGGSGNGPAYVEGPVEVIGVDIYGLDADNDGIGCEKD
jgi:hypothetical protein